MQGTPKSPIYLNDNEEYKGQLASKHVLNKIIFL
jgi:hypothetical protein